MDAFRSLDDKISVSGVLSAKDFRIVKSLGYSAVFCFQLDDEQPDQLHSADARREAENAGLRFVHVPVSKYDVLTPEALEDARRAFESHDGRILATCASGQRAAIVWAALAARSTPVDAVLASLAKAGFELDFLRDDLEAQADLQRWSRPDGALSGALKTEEWTEAA